MKKVIVSRPALKENLPAIVVVDDGGGQEYCDELKILDHEGAVVARVTGTAMGGESVGGARIWIEVGGNVVTSRREGWD